MIWNRSTRLWFYLASFALGVILAFAMGKTGEDRSGSTTHRIGQVIGAVSVYGLIMVIIAVAIMALVRRRDRKKQQQESQIQ